MSQENNDFCRSWLKLAGPNEAKEYIIIIYNKAPEPNNAHKQQHRRTLTFLYGPYWIRKYGASFLHRPTTRPSY